MNRKIFTKTAAVLLACLLLYCPKVFALENGGVFDEDWSNAIQTTVIFINGKMVSGGYDIYAEGVPEAIGYDYVIENDILYVPTELIQNELNITVDTASTNYPTVEHNGQTYIAIRPLAEDLGMTVSYAPEMTGPYRYYYDTTMPISPADTIIRSHPNIFIDKPYDGPQVSEAEAMKATKEKCLEALKVFRENILKEAPTLADDIDGIEIDINRMLYIGEVSCFYKFTIGPYDVLYDKYTGEVFFIIHSSSTLIKKVDVNDNGLYIPVFIVG